MAEYSPPKIDSITVPGPAKACRPEMTVQIEKIVARPAGSRRDR